MKQCTSFVLSSLTPFTGPTRMPWSPKVGSLFTVGNGNLLPGTIQPICSPRITDATSTRRSVLEDQTKLFIECENDSVYKCPHHSVSFVM
jgi:hypothetical protein